VEGVDHGDLLDGLLGATASCADGTPLGTTCAAYTGLDSGRVEWVALHLRGAAGERVVPLVRTRRDRDRGLVLDVRRDAVERAPLAPPTDLGAADEDLLFGYWAQVLCPVLGGPVAAVGPDRRLAGASAVDAQLARVTL
jgi:hypothetical protein